MQRMSFSLHSNSSLQLSKGNLLLLTQGPVPGFEGPILISEQPLIHLPVGSYLGTDRPILQIISGFWSSGRQQVSQRTYWVKVLEKSSWTSSLKMCSCWKDGFSLAWITLSEKGFAGQRQDTSGPLLPELVQSVLPLCLSQGYLLADKLSELKGLMADLALEQQFDLILTTGGTGVTTQDITPEAALSLVERRLPGFEQAMISASLEKTPHAVISRAVAGIIGKSLIINLPGSPKAVKENLSPLLPALKHTLDKIHDDPRECAIS